MNKRIQSISGKIRKLEEELAVAVREREDKAAAILREQGADLRRAQVRLKVGILRFLRTSRPQNVASAPAIYGMFVPLVFLDLSVMIYQGICFPLYGIARVDRRRYISMDRHKLPYLNLIEKINCDYCSYANGLIAYVREVLSRTEQYWCPIKHERMAVASHSRSKDFIPYGQSAGFHVAWEKQRKALLQEEKA